MENKESNKWTGAFELYKQFKLNDWIVFGLLSVTNIAVPTTFSCMAPFFNDVAANKGLTLSEVGIVFGVFNLGSTCGAIFFGKFISIFGCKRIFIFGMLFTSAATICFAFTNLIQSKYLYLISTLTLRILQAFGSSAFLTCSYTLAARLFPNAISTLMGAFETFSCIGYAVGPIIGSFFYTLGGYSLPFIVLSFTLFVIGLISIFFISDLVDQKSNDQALDDLENGGFKKLLSSKDILLLLGVVSIVGFTYTALDPILPLILIKEFNLSFIKIGMLFGLISLGFAIVAPIYGYFIDNQNNASHTLYIGGGLVTALSFYLMGIQIYPLFTLNLSSYTIILFLFGCSGCAIYVPTFKSLLDTVKAQAFPDTITTTSYVSGAFSASYNLGGFLGPIICSFIADYVGYKWTMTCVAVLVATYTIIFTLLFILPKRRSKVGGEVV